jgi:hypothetical protein
MRVVGGLEKPLEDSKDSFQELTLKKFEAFFLQLLLYVYFLCHFFLPLDLHLYQEEKSFEYLYK